jgi:hypothetical protein
MRLRANFLNLGNWLDGSLKCPDLCLILHGLRPALRAFILESVSAVDYGRSVGLSDKRVQSGLCKHHKFLSVYAQAALLKALDIKFRPNIPMNKTNS